MEEWYLPGSRPDGLVHRTVQYVAEDVVAATAAAAFKAQQGTGGGSVSPSPTPGSGPAQAAAGGTGSRLSRVGSGILGLRRQASQRRRSSVVVAGWMPNEMTVGTIQEEFVHSPVQGTSQLAEQNPGGYAAAAAAVGGPGVVERRFDLQSGQLQVVREATPADDDASGAAAAHRDEAGRTTHTYSECCRVLACIPACSPSPAAGHLLIHCSHAACTGSAMQHAPVLLWAASLPMSCLHPAVPWLVQLRGFTVPVALPSTLPLGAGLEDALIEDEEDEEEQEGEGDEASPAQQHRREFDILRTASRAAHTVVREAEEETWEVLQSMQRQEQSTSLETPHYDATRVKVRRSGQAVCLFACFAVCDCMV